MKDLSKGQPILLVEDNDEDFEATKRAFGKTGLKNPIFRCEDGDDALDYLFQRGDYTKEKAPRPGIILLDLNMPGTDGREVLKTIKSDESLKSIPVVVLTTSKDAQDIQDCYASGANSYMHKPVDLHGFFHAIERLANYWFEFVIFPKE